jgi:hypothetical protein
MADCTGNSTLRLICGIAACCSSIVSLVATIRNLLFIPARVRYPGRLISLLGIAIMLLDFATATGFLVGYRQLENNSSGNLLWQRACVIQGAVVEAALILMAAYSFWVCLGFSPC